MISTSSGTVNKSKMISRRMFITSVAKVAILMGIELILNSANINLVAFNRFSSNLNNLDGHVFSIFVGISFNASLWSTLYREYNFR